MTIPDLLRGGGTQKVLEKYSNFSEYQGKIRVLPQVPKILEKKYSSTTSTRVRQISMCAVHIYLHIVPRSQKKIQICEDSIAPIQVNLLLRNKCLIVLSVYI